MYSSIASYIPVKSQSRESESVREESRRYGHPDGWFNTNANWYLYDGMKDLTAHPFVQKAI